MKGMGYTVVIEKTRTGYSAYVPDLPGCVAVARTAAKVRKLIAEAVELHVQDMRQRGRKIPKPTTVSHTVELQSA